MNANIEFSGRVIEVDYERSRLLVRYEGASPEIGAKVIFTGLPVAYQHHYPDGTWRVNNGETVDGLRPDQSRPLYAALTPDPGHPAADALRWAGFGPEDNAALDAMTNGKRSTSAATASGHELPNDTAAASAAASLSVANGGDARVASAGCPPIDPRIRDALLHAETWISSAPHGDNCYVSDHYEGDPGDRCNCGKESALSSVEQVLEAIGIPAAQEDAHPSTGGMPREQVREVPRG